jgi:hypothetical protein
MCLGQRRAFVGKPDGLARQDKTAHQADNWAVRGGFKPHPLKPRFQLFNELSVRTVL